MSKLDTAVDAFEEQIALAGVLTIDLQQFAPDDPSMSAEERAKILVEMLRVWIEHRWQAGHPVSTSDCLAEFPDAVFSPDDIEALRFEERRQIGIATQTRSSSPTGSRPIDDLPTPGEVWGEFELLDILGVGAFAKVYLAKQSGLAGRLVALKLTFRQTFESQWLATLQHSAIVPVYSIHQVDEVYGICMPYLGNTTLADLLRETSPNSIYAKRSWWQNTRTRRSTHGKALLTTIQNRHSQIDTIVNTVSKLETVVEVGDERKSPVSPGVEFATHQLRSTNQLSQHTSSPAARNLIQCDYEQAICWIGAQLADALAYAHRQGIMHSDVKPANVLLASDGQPRLLDFNVSFSNDKQTLITPESPLGGTIAYMSPEHRQAFDTPTVLDPRSDIYSLGVVLFEMLTCRLPNRSDIASSSPVLDRSPRRWNGSVSPALSAIVSKCLAPNPDERYATADQLCDDLTAQFQHEPLVHQSEPSSVERVAKWCHLHPRLSSSLTIISASAMLVSCLLAGLFYRGKALEQADWIQRTQQLRHELPNVFALLTSLESVRELENETTVELDRALSLVLQSDGASAKIDPRWERDDGVVDDGLKAILRQVLWLASKHDWKSESKPKCIALISRLPKPTEDSHGHLLGLVDQKKWSEALPELRSNVRSDPKDFVSWWLLGACANLQGDFPLALQAYTANIAIEPSAIAYFNRGWMRFKGAQFALAVEDYREVIRRAPTWNQVRLNLAITLQKMGRFAEALRELDLAIDNHYRTTSVYRLRGELHLSIGKNAEAMNDLMSALECKPTNDQEWIDRGWIQMMTQPQNPRASLDAFEAAIRLNPSNVDAYQKLAYVYSELLHQPEESVRYLTQLVDMNESNPAHRAERSVVNARAGNTQDVLEDLKLLETMVVTDAMVMYQIACAYSLIAGNPSMIEKSNQDQLGKSAARWYLRAIESDKQIADIAMTDPDVQWMREQTLFRDIQNAVGVLKTLKMNNP